MLYSKSKTGKVLEWEATLNETPNEKGIQFKQGSQWLLYKDYQDTKSETYLTASGLSVVNTKWTQKGRQFIYELLKGEINE